MPRADAIAAIATASGPGAVGIVRVSGTSLSSLAFGILGRLPFARCAELASFLDAQGGTIDRGLALFFPAPSSYTGEDVLELQGHGNSLVLQTILERCLELGARIARPGEFSYRAFLNGKLDLAQAEAVADIVSASSAASARAAVRSLSGAFSKNVSDIALDVGSVRVLVEASIDFSDEDLPSKYFLGISDRLVDLRATLDALLLSARSSQTLRDGLKVVLVGPPNSGKSSLLNRLAGEDLAIVSEYPGTTRDKIYADLILRGSPIRVVDTAGLRETVDEVERAGIERTWRELDDADVVVVLRELNSNWDLDLSRVRRDVPLIKVVNKIDLHDVSPKRNVRVCADEIWISAKTGAGVDMLELAIVAALRSSLPDESVFLARKRHIECLQECSRHLKLAIASSPESIELVAEELRLAQCALDSVTGRVTSDEVLGEIFSSFCIGK